MRVDEFVDASEAGASELFVGEFFEQRSTKLSQEAEVGVKRRCRRRWRGLSSQAFTMGWVLCGVVVQHQVDVEVCRDLAVDDLEEREELAVTMPPEAVVHHIAGGCVQRREQRRGGCRL
jgi:hypothetical protein